jgi:hypothetical protein
MGLKKGNLLQLHYSGNTGWIDSLLAVVVGNPTKRRFLLGDSG